MRDAADEGEDVVRDVDEGPGKNVFSKSVQLMLFGLWLSTLFMFIRCVTLPHLLTNGWLEYRCGRSISTGLFTTLSR